MEKHGIASSAPAQAPPADSSEEICLLEILVVLLERKRLIFWITASCALIALIVSFLLPKWYTASATLLPRSARS